MQLQLLSKAWGGEQWLARLVLALGVPTYYHIH